MTKPKRKISGIVIFNDSFINKSDALTKSSLPLVPPVDLYETKDCYVMNAELPGVELSDVHVEVRGSELSIWGERKVDSCCCDENYHRVEGIRGRFHRTFTLPESFDERAQVVASLKDGVLRVELPKAARSKQISIEP